MPTIGMAAITPAVAMKQSDSITAKDFTTLATCLTEDICMGDSSNTFRASMTIPIGATTQTRDATTNTDTISPFTVIFTVEPS
jgi:hypothetical protein